MKKIQSLIKNDQFIHLFFLIIILCLGTYLRLYRISEYMTFLGDEGRDALVVKRMIIDHKFTLLGPTASVGGFFLGPIYYYFMLPFLWAFQLDPSGPAVMVALFGIATIYFVYLVGKEFFDKFTGLISASLYAISPVVIAFSRSSWNPNLVPFFSILLIYILWRIVLYGKWRELFWIGFIIGIGLQLHYLFLFLVLVSFLWLALYGEVKKHILHYGLIVAGFFVGFFPFIVFELRHKFPNTQTIVKFLLQGEETGFDIGRFFANIIDVPFRLFGRLPLRLPQHEIWELVPSLQLTASKVLIWTTIFASFILCAYMLLNKNKRGGFDSILRKKECIYGIKLLLLWLCVPVILFGFYKRGIFDYYFGIFFALPFLLLAFLLRYMTLIRVGRVFAILLYIFLFILSWQGRPFKYPPNRQVDQVKAIAKEALAKTEGKPFNFALIAVGNSDHAYRYFFEIWGSPPVVIENEINDPERKTVTDQLIVICEHPDCKPLGHPLWEIAGFGQAEIVGLWDVSFVKILKLVHYKEKV